jgi:hypothetical protein
VRNSPEMQVRAPAEHRPLRLVVRGDGIGISSRLPVSPVLESEARRNILPSVLMTGACGAKKPSSLKLAVTFLQAPGFFVWFGAEAGDPFRISPTFSHPPPFNALCLPAPARNIPLPIIRQT